MERFQNRKLLIATKNEKERVIAPILEQALGVHCFIDATFDTDQLGTFTGEIERELDPVSTVREKCLRAMKHSNCNLGIASEGSFGPHPSLYFVSADDEFLIFIDTVHQIEIILRELSTETNFDGRQIHNEKALLVFAEQAGFGSHGVILRKSKDSNLDIHKGITDLKKLIEVYTHLDSKYNSVYAETDMRAMYNPRRMAVIEKAAVQLVEKIKSCCPNCQMPGFEVTKAPKGLPCGLCGSPTNSTLSHISVCKHCQFSQEELYPHQKRTEDPTYCDYCNP